VNLSPASPISSTDTAFARLSTGGEAAETPCMTKARTPQSPEKPTGPEPVKRVLARALRQLADEVEKRP
jgi:hypothetical protein